MVDFSKAPEGATHYQKAHKVFYRDSVEGVQYFHPQRLEWRRSFVFDSLQDYGLTPIPKQK